MARVLLIVALLAVAFWVYSIVDCAMQDPTRHRGVSKPVWLLIVILVPVLGGILWFAIGRTSRAVAARRQVAPDDDLAFLGSLSSITDTDERIRELEAQLAALDAEEPSYDPPRDEPLAEPDAGDDDSDETSDRRGGTAG